MISDAEILRALQDGLPVERRPYAKAAASLGVTEEELLARLGDMLGRGVIKRISATINHFAAGWRANAMVAWQVAPERLAEAGEAAAQFDEVSHCYERETAREWPYNLYTMAHGRDEQACAQTIRRLSAAIKPADFIVLHRRREYKKSPPR